MIKSDFLTKKSQDKISNLGLQQTSKAKPAVKKMPFEKLTSYHNRIHQLSNHHLTKTADQFLFKANSGIIVAHFPGQICKFGTGILISKRIVLTCLHHLVRDGKTCLFVQLILSKNSKVIYNNPNEDQIIYKSAKDDFLRYQTNTNFKQLNTNSLCEDIAMVFLETDTFVEIFPNVGIFSGFQVEEGSKFILSGFTSDEFQKQQKERSNIVLIDRYDKFGEIIRIKEDNVDYQFQSKRGYSGGSGLLQVDGDFHIILIHTHVDHDANQSYGVYLSAKILERLIIYEIQFSIFHPDYKPSIHFPESMREKVIKNYFEHKTKASIRQKVQQAQNEIQQHTLNKSLNILRAKSKEDISKILSKNLHQNQHKIQFDDQYDDEQEKKKTIRKFFQTGNKIMKSQQSQIVYASMKNNDTLKYIEKIMTIFESFMGKSKKDDTKFSLMKKIAQNEDMNLDDIRQSKTFEDEEAEQKLSNTSNLSWKSYSSSRSLTNFNEDGEVSETSENNRKFQNSDQIQSDSN